MRAARMSGIALCIKCLIVITSSNAIYDAKHLGKFSTVRQAMILAALYFLSMATKLAANRIAERKLRDKQARRAQIISAARRIAELEGWSNVTVRRLSDEISYSQPVLYAHFGSREGILAAVAIEGFQELGLALEKARKRVKRGGTVESVAAAYLEFAASSPALYEVMFSLSLSVPFGDAATPPELRFAFSQLLELFQRQSSKSEVLSELFWASLHGIAELTRTKRFPRSRQKERVRALVELFTFPRDETARVVKAR
jgi:AcrR family transcriptional regulator